MIRVSLRYGTNRLSDVAVTAGSTVGSIKEAFGAALRLPESVQALVNNDPNGIGNATVLKDGDTVTFEKEACKKA